MRHKPKVELPRISREEEIGSLTEQLIHAMVKLEALAGRRRTELILTKLVQCFLMEGTRL